MKGERQDGERENVALKEIDACLTALCLFAFSVYVRVRMCVSARVFTRLSGVIKMLSES